MPKENNQEDNFKHGENATQPSKDLNQEAGNPNIIINLLSILLSKPEIITSITSALDSWTNSQPKEIKFKHKVFCLD